MMIDPEDIRLDRKLRLDGSLGFGWRRGKQPYLACQLIIKY